MTQNAIVVGASSGIGRELSLLLAELGYCVGIAARREKLLVEISRKYPDRIIQKRLDVSNVDDARKKVADFFSEMGNVDLFVYSAGTGHLNSELHLDLELETINTNIEGFVNVSNVVFHKLKEQGYGHFVGISSIASIRGHADAPAYNASKAFMSNYLQGIRHRFSRLGLPITVTDIQPGFVDTDMAKGDGVFWAAPPRKAAEQIFVAIKKKKRKAYVTKRWWVLAYLIKLIPEWMILKS